MRYGSVCSGIEAATMAWHKLGWSPAFFSEIEPFPSAVLAHHYGSNMPGEPLAKNGIPNYGDFTKIGADAGPVDLLVGGTPCQSFSVAGKRLGLDDPRGNLALEYLALARRLRARWIVWENVPGVLSSHTDDEQAEEDEGDDGLESADFATFLSFVQECGYGFAYRVLDAQYIRVDEYARAVPQRRRRVFLVGYLGDWRRAAAVLLEPESMRGDSAPRREAGKRTSGTIDASAARSRGAGTNPGMIADGAPIPFDTTQITSRTCRSNPSAGDPCHTLSKGAHPPAIAFGGNNQSGPIDVATALNAHGGPAGRMDFESETFVAHAVAPAITRNQHADNDGREGLLVAHSLRGEGFDASEDGTGRGTPIVPVFAPQTAATLTRGAESAGKGGYAGRRQEDDQNLVAFAQNQRDEVRTVEVAGALAAEPGMKQQTYVAAPPALAFQERGRTGGRSLEYQEEVAYSMNDPNGWGRRNEFNVAQGWAVRRLMPIECERLQGFPDGYTNIPWRGKDTAPDGPRYKALGNSFAVNVCRWIGQRIQILENLEKEGKL